MSSIWTPGGERPVRNEGEGDAPSSTPSTPAAPGPGGSGPQPAGGSEDQAALERELAAMQE
ncbi:MAG TPA: hypothetical protein VM386_01720, partial [Acidimicrobiales bacterium]|nr:hypothetical protein [Acidimicrobiales bacterium]